MVNTRTHSPGGACALQGAMSVQCADDDTAGLRETPSAAEAELIVWNSCDCQRIARRAVQKNPAKNPHCVIFIFYSSSGPPMTL